MQVTRDSTPVVVRAGRRKAAEPHTKTRGHEAECRSLGEHRSLTGQFVVEHHAVAARHPRAGTGATHLGVGVRIAKTHSGFFAGLISTPR
jgi:hypothetical protein